MKKKCFMFPGQGSQSVNMLKNIKGYLNDYYYVIECASDISRKNIYSLLANGSIEEISSANNIQYVITTINILYFEMLKSKAIQPDISIGHSLGQFCALYSCGSISMEELFTIIKRRTEIYEENPNKGVLVAVLGLNIKQIEKICNQIDPFGNNLSVALYNSDNNIVIGGYDNYVEKFIELCKEYSVYKTIYLNTPNAYHTNIMKPINDKFVHMIDNINLNEPSTKLVLNSYAKEVKTEIEIKSDFKLHATHTDRWRDVVKLVLSSEDVDFIECGNGRNLSGHVKSIDKEHSIYTVSNFKDLCKLMS